MLEVLKVRGQVRLACVSLSLFDLKGKEKGKGKTTQAAKSSSHQLRKRGHLGRKAPSPEEKRVNWVKALAFQVIIACIFWCLYFGFIFGNASFEALPFI